MARAEEPIRELLKLPSDQLIAMTLQFPRAAHPSRMRRQTCRSGAAPGYDVALVANSVPPGRAAIGLP